MSHRSPNSSPPPATAQASPTIEQSDGLAWLSWLRVVAIAAVVLIHTAGLTAVAPDARSTTRGQIAIALDFSSRWSVPVFVMLSGALLLDPARYRGTTDFLRRRAMRLVPAVIVWHLVYLAYIIVLTDTSMTAGDALRRTLTGQLFTALYFFWIVLGLAVITPILVPWIATATRRALLVAGLGAAMLPALALVTVPIRHPGLNWHADLSWVETPWTWWLPYLGYYILGYALRDIVLTRWRLALAAGTVLAASVLLSWQWRQTDGIGGWLERYLPAEAYFSPTLIVFATSVFLVARAVARPGGLFKFLCRPRPTMIGRRLGDATLGVFAVHLLVLELMYRLPILGGERAADSAELLAGRCLFVFVVAYLISLICSRIPGIRRVF